MAGVDEQSGGFFLFPFSHEKILGVSFYISLAW
jgi:hypothetical protein